MFVIVIELGMGAYIGCSLLPHNCMGPGSGFSGVSTVAPSLIATSSPFDNSKPVFRDTNRIIVSR